MQFTESSTLAKPYPCILIASVICTCKASLYGQKNAPVQRPHLWQTGVAMPANITPARAKMGLLGYRQSGSKEVNI